MPRSVGSKNGQYGVVIDKEQFEKLCSIFCTEKEICGFFDVSHDTLNRWCNQEYEMNFEDVFKIKSAYGRISIRRMQFRQAEKNPTMAIWLGKQYLDQTDKVETTMTNKIEVISDVPTEQ